jgi:hypothetical protein
MDGWMVYFVKVGFIHFIDINTDVAALFLCLMESICRFDSYYLHQNGSPGRSLRYSANIALLLLLLVIYRSKAI